MHIEKDYEELLESLNRHDVRYCINLENLIRAKRASGRTQDQADLEVLEQVRG